MATDTLYQASHTCIVQLTTAVLFQFTAMSSVLSNRFVYEGARTAGVMMRGETREGKNQFIKEQKY